MWYHYAIGCEKIPLCITILPSLPVYQLFTIFMQENNVQIPADVPHSSEGFGEVPKDAESFGSIPNGSEIFRIVPKGAGRNENHTLTVREVARRFDAAGVARTERSVTNWCQPNKSGIARLDAYFDPNERRYLITPQSAELAVQEEKARMAKINEPSEPVGSLPKAPERQETPPATVSEASAGKIKELEHEIMDLRITNRGKDFFIQQLQKEREGHIQQLMTSSHRIGELETKLLALEAPAGEDSH
jgi:hypothetical protein